MVTWLISRHLTNILSVSLLSPLRLSCNTESFTVEGASIEHELIPVVTSDVNVYGMCFDWLLF